MTCLTCIYTYRTLIKDVKYKELLNINFKIYFYKYYSFSLQGSQVVIIKLEKTSTNLNFTLNFLCYLFQLDY